MSNSILLYHRARGYGLSRELWLIQAGILVNALGWGAVLPFEVIYLHDGRGFGLGESGAIVGAITGLGVVASPAAGFAIDRFGARSCGAWAAVLLAAGYTWLALAHTPLEAFLGRRLPESATEPSGPARQR
jgi:MFS family permease